MTFNYCDVRKKHVHGGKLGSQRNNYLKMINVCTVVLFGLDIINATLQL